jgi:hypothetical protein
MTARLDFATGTGVPGGLANANVTSITAIDAAPSGLWVGTNGANGASGQGHLFTSTTNGASWTEVTYPAQSSDVEVASIGHLGSLLYIAVRQSAGVRLYGSSDAGATWTQLGTAGLGNGSNYPSARLASAWGRLWIALAGTSSTTPSLLLSTKDTTSAPVTSSLSGFSGATGCPSGCSAVDPAIAPLGNPVGRVLWGGQDATGTNGAQVFNVIDSAAPTGSTLTASPSGVTNASSISLSFTTGGDDVSGISEWSLQRAYASAPVGGSCTGASYGGFAQQGPLNPAPGPSALADTGAATSGCYRYKLALSDFAGHTSFAGPVDVLVDHVSPTGTIAAATGPISGTVTITGTGADAESGVQGVTVTYSGVGSGTICTSPPTPASWSCTWNTSGLPDGTYSVQLLVHDLAGNASASITRSFTVDNTAPVEAFVSWATPSAWAWPNGNDLWFNPSAPGPQQATVTVHATDVNGVQRVDFQGAASTGWSGPSTASVTSGSAGDYSTTYTFSSGAVALPVLMAHSFDLAGNSPVGGVSYHADIDATAPTVSGFTFPVGFSNLASASISLGTATDGESGMASTRVERRVGALVGGACATWGAWSQLGGNNPAAPFGDSGLAAGSCYDYRLVATDHVGNVTTTTPAGDLKVDTIAPTPSLTVPSGPHDGTVTLSGSATDGGGSGLASVSVTVAPQGGGASTNGCTGGISAGSWSCGFDTTLLTDGAYVVSAATTDAAGNVATTSANLVVDHTAPTPDTVGYPSGNVASASVHVTFSGATDANGLSGRVLERATAPLADNACAWGGANLAPASIATLSAATTSYDDAVPDASCVRYRVVTSDLAGLTVASADGPELRVDRIAPTISAPTIASNVPLVAAGGSQWMGPALGPVLLSVTGTSADAASGVARIEVPDWSSAGFTASASTVTPSLSGAWNAGWTGFSVAADLPAGTVRAVDRAGNASAGIPVALRVDSTPPVGFDLQATLDVSGDPRVAIHLTPGDDAQTGIASVGVSRRPGERLSTGCAAGAGPLELLVGPAGVYDGIDTPPYTGCVEYVLQAVDKVGNTATVSSVVDVPGPVTNVTPTAGDDALIGTNGGDVIDGGLGDDHVDGGLGDDQIFGGAGFDELFGGAGKDVIDGGLGYDAIDGGLGNDQLYGGSGDDDVQGGIGNDYLAGGPGRDQLHGGAGNDTIIGNDGADAIDGGGGNDAIDARDASKAGSKGAPKGRGWFARILAKSKKVPPDTVKCGKGKDTVKADGNDIVAKDCERVVRPRIKLIR